MLLRSLIPLACNLAAATCLVTSATSTTMPKDLTCHIKLKTEGKQTVDQLSTHRDGIVSWHENEEFTSVDCGQTKWPPTKERCFGFAESDGTSAVTTGYCVDTDSDGDKIVWKIPAIKAPLYALTLSGYNEVLMGSGKYKDMSGKTTYECVYGGTFELYTATCSMERILKFP